MAALLLLYLLFAIQYAIRLIVDPEPVAKAIGVALLVLPLLGIFALVAELRFGVRGERMLRELTPDDDPLSGIATRASGRPERADALERFPDAQARVEASPDDWRAWAGLGIVYDACGDRRRARWAMRKAIALRAAR
jgi:hypothetical protein